LFSIAQRSQDLLLFTHLGISVSDLGSHILHVEK